MLTSRKAKKTKKEPLTIIINSIIIDLIRKAFERGDEGDSILENYFLQLKIDVNAKKIIGMHYGGQFTDYYQEEERLKAKNQRKAGHQYSIYEIWYNPKAETILVEIWVNPSFPKDLMPEMTAFFD